MLTCPKNVGLFTAPRNFSSKSIPMNNIQTMISNDSS